MFLSTCFRALLLRLSILAVMTAFCGCTPINVLTNHVVMFNENGRLLDPTGNIDCNDPPALCKGRHLSILSYKELNGDQRKDYMKDLLDGLRDYRDSTQSAESSSGRGPDDRGKPRLLVFVHGGLNTQKGSVERVEKLAPEIMSAGYYPLFINWRSSWVFNYFNHLMYIRQGEKSNFLLGLISSPFVFAFDLGRGVLRTPLILGSQVIEGYQTWSDTHLPYGLDDREKTLKEKYEQSPSGSNSGAIGILIGKDDRSWADKTLAGISWFVFLPFRLFSIPIIDGLGTSAWDNMLRQTQSLIHTSDEYRDNDPGEMAAHGDLAYVMRELQSELKNGWEIMLVGHSMGTIVLNELLREFPDVPVDNIIYMAAACSVHDFEQSVIPYLRRNNTTNFYNLSLHHIAENRERWEPLKIPYVELSIRGSLLAWLDDFFTNPLTPMDKTLGKYVNFLRTEQIYSSDLRGRIHQKEFSVGGRFTETDPQKHGDFDRFEFWEESFYRLPPPQ